MGHPNHRGFLDADITNETHDQRKIARFVNGNRHARYREMNRQIMQLNDPTFAEVVKFATTFEVADRTARDLTQPTHAAVKVVAGGRSSDVEAVAADGVAEEEDQEGVSSATGTESARGVNAVRESQYRSSWRGKMQQGVKAKAEQSRGAALPGQRPRASPGNEDGPKCGNCGRDSSHEKCPAAGLACHECGKFGHFARCCRSRPKNLLARACKAQVDRVELELPEADARNARAMRSFASAPYIPPVVENPVVSVRITGIDRFGREHTRTAQLLPDSGSSVTMLPTHMARRLGWTYERMVRPLRLATCGKSGVETPYSFEGAVQANGGVIRTTLYVAPDVPAVLSSAVCYALKILIRPDRGGNTGMGYSATGGGIATRGRSGPAPQAAADGAQSSLSPPRAARREPGRNCSGPTEGATTQAGESDAADGAAAGRHTSPRPSSATSRPDGPHLAAPTPGGKSRVANSA